MPKAAGQGEIPLNAFNSSRALASPITHTQPSSPDFRWLDSLPYRDSLELGAYDSAPRMARSRLAGLLREWSLAEFTDVAALVTSELITNSVAETARVPWPGGRPPVRLWLRGGPSVVAPLIWDAVTRPPVPRVAGHDEENGRGLAIVRELSAAWGYYYSSERGSPQCGGKVTWAIITAP
jgi:hypothetical protein